jgi:hypothetical protein
MRVAQVGTEQEGRRQVSDEQEATARVNAALDRNEKPTGDDLMACDLAALLRAARINGVKYPIARGPFTVTPRATAEGADAAQGQGGMSTPEEELCDDCGGWACRCKVTP